MNRVLMILAMVIWGITPLQANNKAEAPNHLILAVNWAPSPQSSSWMFMPDTQKAIDELSQFEVENGVGERTEILREGDVFSCLAFRANIDQKSLEHYVRPICLSSDSLVYIKNTYSKFAELIKTEWSKCLTSDPYGDSQCQSFSMLTLAKPYCLKYFSTCDRRQQVSRTFMIIVSDRVFNGDMYYEVINLRQFISHYYQLDGMADEDVFPTCYDVNQSYFIRHLQTRKIQTSLNANPVGYVELYEFVPLQKNFSLNAVLDMPQLIKAKRIRGGKYEIALSITNRENDNYAPMKLSLRLNGNELKVYGAQDLVATINQSFIIEEDNKSTVLDIEGDVLLIDNVYNSTLITSNPKLPVELGSRGAVVHIPIEYESPARIFWIIPLSDFFWFSFFPDDQYIAALIWQVILMMLLIMLVVVLVIMYIRKKMYYTPIVSELKFNIPNNLKK